MKKLTPQVVIVDSREQTPWSFGNLKTVRRGLATGDYSLLGHADPPNGVIVERKAPGDLVSCMCRGRDRFVRELERLAEYRCSFIIVEAHLDRIVADLTLSRMSPASRIGTLTAWWHRYPTIRWLFAPGPEFAARLAIRIFDRYVREREATEAAA